MHNFLSCAARLNTVNTKMLKTYTLSDCKIIHLNKMSDARGNLTFIEGSEHVPFDILRVYYIYDVPAGSQRAGHAHKNLFQLLISIAGSFDIHLDDGINQSTVCLNRPYEGLLVTPMIWRVINNFSSGAVCLALASDHYDESSYYRDFDDFLKAKELETPEIIAIRPAKERISIQE